MQPDYQKIMAERQQQEQQRYQQTRDPFEYGRQVAQRRYSEIMSGLDAQKAATQKSYGDMYQQARQMAVGRQAAGGPTLSGGMGQQQRDFVSTAEMQQLGQIQGAGNQAMRDLYTQAQSAMSNAQLEGQQATQMELQNRQAKLGIAQQAQEIMDSGLSKEDKEKQLEALGVDTSQLDVENGGFDWTLGWSKAADDPSAGNILGALGKTALLAGAIYFFGPTALSIVKGLGTKLVVGSGGKVLLGAKGWAGVAKWFKTPAAAATVAQTVSSGASAAFNAATPIGVNAALPMF